jgi:hypothetical protein
MTTSLHKHMFQGYGWKINFEVTHALMSTKGSFTASS